MRYIVKKEINQQKLSERRKYDLITYENIGYNSFVLMIELRSCCGCNCTNAGEKKFLQLEPKY